MRALVEERRQGRSRAAPAVAATGDLREPGALGPAPIERGLLDFRLRLADSITRENKQVT